jgi:hypothetical protein
VFFLAGPGPGSVTKLLFEDSLCFWQLPQAVR